MADRPNRFDGLIDAWTPRLRAAFLDAVYRMRSAAQVGLIAEMLERGDIDSALRACNLDPTQFRGLDKTISDAFEAAGNYTADGLPPLRQTTGHKLSISFDARNPRAEAWLRDHSSKMITAIVDDQRAAIREHLTAGMAAGVNPKAVALDLVGRINSDTRRREGGVVGLTASQEAWARNYAAELASSDANALTRNLRDKRFDRSVKAAIESGKPIPADTQAKMVAAYRTRALRLRGETIGRTEALTSLHQGQHEAMQQGIDKGQVAQTAVTKIWHSAADSRVRETHRALNRQSVAMNGLFQSPSGATLRFPGDPNAPAAERCNCRCTCQYRVNFFAGVT